MRDPRAFNFVTGSASNGVPVVASFDSEGHPRPWYQALRVRAVDGYLREGDILTVVFGDRSAGSPGLRMQTFLRVRPVVQGSGGPMCNRALHPGAGYSLHLRDTRSAGCVESDPAHLQTTG